MNMLIQPSYVRVDGEPVGTETAPCSIRFEHNSFDIHLFKQQGVSIYAFNSLMLRGRVERKEIDKFVFDGPKLGLYSDTIDIREGPYINHGIKHLEITVKYPSKGEAHIDLIGKADLSESYFDHYWYKGKTSGEWIIELSFKYIFP